jgi:hypothetical protein
VPNALLPGAHPLPPHGIARARLPLKITAQSWFRFHGSQHSAVYWGVDPPRPFAFRFDAPNHEFGVLYAGADEHAAFIESFGHNRVWVR